jgi:hypothetical protein
MHACYRYQALFLQTIVHVYGTARKRRSLDQAGREAGVLTRLPLPCPSFRLRSWLFMLYVRLALDFSTHPKVVSITPLAELLFVRALLYSGKYLTDGFIPEKAVFHLTCDMDCYGIEADDLVSELCNIRLWRSVKAGFHIHDYLGYQRSREAVEEYKAKKAEINRKNGMLGGRPPKPRNPEETQNGLSRGLQVDNPDETQKNPDYTSSSSSSTTEREREERASTPPRPKRKAPAKMTDEEWFANLQTKEIYQGIDIPRLHQRMQVWCEEKGLKPTRSRLLNWLNREDKLLKQPQKKTGHGKVQL